MKLLLTLVLSTLISLGVLSLVFTTFSKAVFSEPTQDRSVLEQAQMSLQANQNQSSSVNQQQQDAPASKINKGAGSFSTYENTDYQISIKFPNSWKHSEVNLPQHGIVTFSAPEFGTPLSEVYVAYPAEVLVASQKLPVNNLTLPKFVESFLKDRYPNATDYKIISSSKSNFGGIESDKLIMYEYDVGGLFYAGGSLKLMRNIAIDHKTDIAYMIKYSAEPGMFSKYLSIAQEMVNSFRIK